MLRYKKADRLRVTGPAAVRSKPCCRRESPSVCRWGSCCSGVQRRQAHRRRSSPAPSCRNPSPSSPVPPPADCLPAGPTKTRHRCCSSLAVTQSHGYQCPDLGVGGGHKHKCTDVLTWGGGGGGGGRQTSRYQCPDRGRQTRLKQDGELPSKAVGSTVPASYTRRHFK